MIRERIKRYKDRRSRNIKEWTEEYEAENFLRDEKTKLATYKISRDCGIMHGHNCDGM